MDADQEYVELIDDERGGRDKRGQPAKLRRYKDDAYRYAARRHFDNVRRQVDAARRQFDAALTTSVTVQP